MTIASSNTPETPRQCECKWAAWHAAQAAKAAELSARETALRQGLQASLAAVEKQPYKAKIARIPALKPHRIHAYIGAVSRAVQRGEITAAQANGMLYAAQLAISANRQCQPPPPPATTSGASAAKAKTPKGASKK